MKNSSLLFAARLLICSALFNVPCAVAALNVVTTLPDYAAIAREVGGDRINVTSLAKPTEDSHFVDARPSFVVKLRAADVLIEGGAELEAGWLPPLLENARNPKIEVGRSGRVVASAGIRLLDVPVVLTRAQGDVHALGNPHFGVDPIVAKAIAAHIAQAFAAADPSNSDFYAANERAFEAKINAKLQEWGAKLQPFRGQALAAYHDSWVYFAHRFGFVIDTFLEPKPGIPPSPSHLADVIAKIRRDHVRAILVEPFHNRKIAEKVASATGIPVVDVAQYPGALSNTDSYIALIDELVNRLATALGSS
ncbi:MAG: metal ABC transporter substrate-binding protein [Opitutaceae bacterium]|jgi:zinc/manganese transport system substrate-binding protein